MSQNMQCTNTGKKVFSECRTHTCLVDDTAQYDSVLLGCVHGRLAALTEKELLLVLLQEL